MCEHLPTIVNKICNFIKNDFGIEVDETSALLGKNAILSSLHTMELIAWCEDTFSVDNLLDDDLFLESLESVSCLAKKILEKGGHC